MTDGSNWYRTLGRTGVKVSPLTLGAMNFGANFNGDHVEATRMIHAAIDGGINLIDTADVYSRGESEEIVGTALGGRRDDIVLATKFHGSMGSDPNHGGNSRRWIYRAVEDSLRRLSTDYIDLYQVHRPDPSIDMDETFGALSDLVRAGKIRYFGTTTFEAHELVEAQHLAERRGYVRAVSEQPPYSILARGAERAVLPVTQQYGIGVLTWSPLAGGWLSGRWRRGVDVPASSTRMKHNIWRHDPELEVNRIKREAAEDLADIAESAGLSMVELALGFVLRHPAVTSVIIGPRTMEQLRDQLEAPSVVLGDDVLDAIDAIVLPGVTINAADAGYAPPSLTTPSARRRHLDGPAVGLQAQT
ncbi:aldo/keto reductase [Microbacterium sp. 18062]|uniref:aldo/keto reductase n=1 Tax=Microbacterium sp. 18062 TaxID=2681410 RepID=UPI00135762BC|nr:aldo/keto reductase [Microbacterium sp. 18062]